MKLRRFEEIYARINFPESLPKILSEFPNEVSEYALLSIYRSKQMQIAIKSLHRHQKLSHTYYQNYLELCKSSSSISSYNESSNASSGGVDFSSFQSKSFPNLTGEMGTFESKNYSDSILIKMSRQINLSSCLLARLIIKEHLQHFHHKSTMESTFSNVFSNVSKGSNVEIEKLGSLEHLLSTTSPTKPQSPTKSKNDYSLKPAQKKLINRMLNNPSLISDPILAREVNACNLDDDCYSTRAEKQKRDTGAHHERILENNLKSLGIEFFNENDQKLIGCWKTPDIRFEIPILYKGKVIFWIESKATFGGTFNHPRYLNDQYWPYRNRYGPGLVIYWHGFIEEFDTLQSEGIFFEDQFPSKSISKFEMILPF